MHGFFPADFLANLDKGLTDQNVLICQALPHLVQQVAGLNASAAANPAVAHRTLPVIPTTALTCLITVRLYRRRRLLFLVAAGAMQSSLAATSTRLVRLL